MRPLFAALVVVLSGLSVPAVADPPAESAVVAARNHLATERYRGEDLVPLATVSDGESETVRFGQRHRGVPVLGGQRLVHLRRAGVDRIATGTGGRRFSGLTVSTTPLLTEATAIERARDFVVSSLGSRLVGRAVAAPVAEVESHGLVVVPRGSGVLTYHLTVRTSDPVERRPVRRQVYLDASAGFPVLDFDSLARAVPGSGETLRGRTVPLRVSRDPDGTHRLQDGPVSTWDASGYDVSQVRGVWPDGIAQVSSPSAHFGGTATSTGAVDAHHGAGRVLDFYRSRFGRDGLDGAGGEVRSLVGVTAFGQPYVNAFWDGSKMVYGGGDDEYYPLSADLDVVGHEMTHGVIEHTANLLYLNQSGAMNEAIADYFGNAIDVETSGMAMTDPDAGLLGEDLCRTKRPRECALRDLNDGATMSDDLLGVTTEWDNGGVHYNSTIFSGALWDIRERLRPRVADRLVYTALTRFMTPLDDFLAGREAMLAAARSLRLSSLEQWVVRRAFDAHGIRHGWQRRVGVDSTTLLRDVTAVATGPSAAGGWWTTSNSSPDGSQPYAVHAGRIGSRGAVRLSPEDGRYHVYPHTDGRVVAWAAYGPGDVRIMTRPVDGSGPAAVLTTIGYPLQNLRVAGDTVAFQVNHVTGTDVLLMRAGWTGPRFVDGGSYRIQTFFPDLSAGKVSYVKRWFDATGNHVAPAVLDLETETETLLPELPGGTGAPVQTGRYLVWPSDLDGDQTDISIHRADLTGTGLRRLVDENHPAAPIRGRVDATDTAITFDTWPSGDLSNRTLPKLHQLPIHGGRLHRVSCNRGAQTWFSADTTTRTTWLDGTLATTTLATRPHPRPHC